MITPCSIAIYLELKRDYVFGQYCMQKKIKFVLIRYFFLILVELLIKNYFKTFRLFLRFLFKCEKELLRLLINSSWIKCKKITNFLLSYFLYQYFSSFRLKTLKLLFNLFRKCKQKCTLTLMLFIYNIPRFNYRGILY